MKVSTKKGVPEQPNQFYTFFADAIKGVRRTGYIAQTVSLLSGCVVLYFIILAFIQPYLSLKIASLAAGSVSLFVGLFVEIGLRVNLPSFCKTLLHRKQLEEHTDPKAILFFLAVKGLMLVPLIVATTALSILGGRYLPTVSIAEPVAPVKNDTAHQAQVTFHQNIFEDEKQLLTDSYAQSKGVIEKKYKALRQEQFVIYEKYKKKKE